MSSTGRPSRPPFLLTSSFQIWMAISAGLPLAERPPVRAMPRPILMGSAARAVGAPSPASANVPMTAAIRTHVPIPGLPYPLIAPSLSARFPTRPARLMNLYEKRRTNATANVCCRRRRSHRHRGELVPQRHIFGEILLRDPPLDLE